MHSATIWTCGAVLLLGACGGSAVTTPAPDGGASDASQPTPPETGPHTSRPDAPGAPCPPAVPAKGASCQTAGLSCEYGGTGDHLLCSTFALCDRSSGGTGPLVWSVGASGKDCVASAAQNPAGCAGRYADVPQGASCSTDQATCVYDEAVCGCVPCSTAAGASAAEWSCIPWPKPAGCPDPRPRAGTACTSDGTTCWYETACGVPNLQPVLQCIDGSWRSVAHGGDCPMATCAR